MWLVYYSNIYIMWLKMSTNIHHVAVLILRINALIKILYIDIHKENVMLKFSVYCNYHIWCNTSYKR